MNWDKFTIKAQEAISEAQKKAEESGHQMIENEHVLLALLKTEGRDYRGDIGEAGGEACFPEE